MTKLKVLVLVLLLSICNNVSSFAENDKMSLNVGADIMSRYIFRGTDYGNSPSFQPILSLKTGDFEIGYWGAIAVNSFYQEIDLYAKYSIDKLSIILTDYYIPSITGAPASEDIRYFNFKDKTTAHTLEAGLSYEFGESFPLKLFGSVFFFGNDKRWGLDEEKDKNEDTYYSTYFELGYPLKIAENKIDIFLGLTSNAGAFGNGLGVINFGFTGYRNIKISNDFELPVKSSVIFNPQASAIHFIFGITL